MGSRIMLIAVCVPFGGEDDLMTSDGIAEALVLMGCAEAMPAFVVNDEVLLQLAESDGNSGHYCWAADLDSNARYFGITDVEEMGVTLSTYSEVLPTAADYQAVVMLFVPDDDIAAADDIPDPGEVASVDLVAPKNKFRAVRFTLATGAPELVGDYDTRQMACMMALARSDDTMNPPGSRKPTATAMVYNDQGQQIDPLVGAF